MNEIWKVYLLCLVVSVSAQTYEYEYEYYYEEVSETSATDAATSPPSEVTTVEEARALEEEIVTEVSTVTLDDATSDYQNMSVVSVGSSKDGIPMHTDEATAVDGEVVNLNSHDVRRTDSTVHPRLNGTHPTKFTNTLFKTTSRPKSNNPPSIVLNIYTGMYGMDSRSNNRPTGNVGGRNNFWPRAQSPLQGWYGMYNRMPVQPFAPRQQRPIYRGRGQQNNYGDSYSSGFTYQKATKPRRNSQQNRGSTMDQEATMAVFNFLLQALGQRSGSSTRSQTQGQQGSRRRV
ncbi:uncharacterized protein LOC118505091 [Anopheles stephensi]|uniref:uncharacterized protein LOC118505091 n=1 Tax=Anopheles stephensi TaxID=30069 RepID=UPI00165892FA|nr:uncharacterized protein LOC118505091 [Anopheles stephensi]